MVVYTSFEHNNEMRGWCDTVLRDLHDIFRDSDRKSRRPLRDEELAEPEDNEPDIDEADGWGGYYKVGGGDEEEW